MEFNQKLQELRKQKELTQDELAKLLFVSRTAISKWESGRGYPNIDSLKAISKIFSISIDELLSSDELLTIAEESTEQKKNALCDLIFGLVDISCIMLLFLPIFAERYGGQVLQVSLLNLHKISLWLKIVYFDFISSSFLSGILTLVFQDTRSYFWNNAKYKISLVLSSLGLVVFILSLQPYPAVLLLFFLIIKVFVITKK